MDEIEKYINIKYSLIEAILCMMPYNILDVSYNVGNDIIDIQFILLENTFMDKSVEARVKENLCDYNIIFEYIYMSKVMYNKNKGHWNPVNYTWKQELLYSKAEVL